MSAATRSGDVAVIIVNYRSWRDTIDCLDSLYRSTGPRMRVLLLDNASPDDSLAQLEQWVRENATRFGGHAAPEIVALDDNLGFAGASNVGLQRAMADPACGYAWLLNGDATVAPDALSRMVALAESDGGVGVVGCNILRADAPELLETAAGGTVSLWTGMARNARANTARGRRWPAPVQLDYVAGTSMLITRAAFERAGPMDERYFLYAEDADWCFQVRRHGLRLAHCAEAEVWHKGGGTTSHRSAVHDYYTVRSVLLFVRKMRPAALPVAIASSLVRFVLPKVARGEWQRLGAVLRAYADFARGRLGRTGAPPASAQNRGEAVNRNDRLWTSKASSMQ